MIDIEKSTYKLDGITYTGMKDISKLPDEERNRLRELRFKNHEIQKDIFKFRLEHPDHLVISKDLFEFIIDGVTKSDIKQFEKGKGNAARTV